MNEQVLKNLGPLAPLAGIWEGDKGDDIAPADDRGTENNKFRERIVFEPMTQVNNHEQTLWGLRYSKIAHRLTEADPFHEELGYWLWDAEAKQVLCCFIIPRGMTVLAGGSVDPAAKKFELSAHVGSDTYGICSNLFLDKEFKTMHFFLKVNVHSDGSWSYEENSQLLVKGRTELFNHTDKNTLKRVKT